MRTVKITVQVQFEGSKTKITRDMHMDEESVVEWQHRDVTPTNVADDMLVTISDKITEYCVLKSLGKV